MPWPVLGFQGSLTAGWLGHTIDAERDKDENCLIVSRNGISHICCFKNARRKGGLKSLGLLT